MGQRGWGLHRAGALRRHWPWGRLAGGWAGSRGLESRRRAEAWDSKDGAVSRPGRPQSAGPRGPSQECPVSTRPGSTPSPCTGDGHGGRVRACMLRGGGRDAPQREQPQASQQAALPPRRTRTAPELARSPLPLRGGAVSLCPLNSPAATSSPFLSKYGCSPYKRPHPSAPQRRRGALANPAPSSGALPEPPDSPTSNALEKQTCVQGPSGQASPLCPSSRVLLRAQEALDLLEAVGIREREVSSPREAQRPRSSPSWPSLFTQVQPRQTCRVLKMGIQSQLGGRLALVTC